MLRSAWLCVCLLGFLGTLQAQNADLNLNDEIYHLVDRLDIKRAVPGGIPTDIKPYAREQLAEWLEKADTTLLHKRDRLWLHRARFLVDDRVPEFRSTKAKWLLPNFRDLLGFRSRQFSIYVNPIFSGQVGYDVHPSGNSVPWNNSRGASVRGTILRKIGFYSEAIDNQINIPGFVRNQFNTYQSLPGESWFKPFGKNGFDYFSAKGYVTYSPIRQLRFKFGRDRAFWGNGMQSMTLSDYATDYLMFSFQLRIWKLEYTTMFTQFIDYIVNKPDSYGDYPRKYGAFHQLSYRPIPQVSISLFEGMVFATELPNGQKRGFELQYLNPLIFFQTAQAAIGSPDNAVLGLTLKANIAKRIQLYGQFLLDDFNFAELRKGNGWYGQKGAWQAGIKWIDMFGVPMLDLQLEHNGATPFTYSHFNVSSNYTHYHQTLAHPLGANFVDANLILRYQPVQRLHLLLRYTFAMKGIDPVDMNFGGTPTLSDLTINTGRPDSRYGTHLLQGDTYTLHNLYLRASYQLWNLNAFIDFESGFRYEQGKPSYTALLGLRLNVNNRPWNF